MLGEIGYGPGVLDANEWKRQWEEPDDALTQTAYAKNMKALASLPTVEEAEEMDPEACKKVLLELYTLRGPVGWSMNQQSPVQCERCRAFAEKMTNKEFGEKLADLFSLTHTAYRQADWNITVGFCHVATLGSRLELLHKEIQEAWEKEKERCNELVNVAQRYQCQLQEPTQDQPPSTDKTPVSLPEDFLTLQGKYFQELSMWCKCISDSDQNAIKALGELMAIQPQYINLKRCNDDYEKQLLQESDSRRTGADDLEKETLGTHKPKGKSGDGEAEAAENPKNLTD